MHLLIATDKFKGSLSAPAVAKALERGLHESNPDLRISKRPLADGGDGSLALLRQYREMERVELEVSDPLGRPLVGHYFKRESKAFIEVAVASGIARLAESQKNPLRTTSLGTGLLIRHAIEAGARTVYLFLGGSATTDGGIGILHGLGFRALDRAGHVLNPIGQNLGMIDAIDVSAVPAEIQQTRFKLICDVRNPLYGPTGAAYVYGPQKGADPVAVRTLDAGLQNLGRVLSSALPEVANTPGLGAAGGIPASLMALFDSQILPGIDFFMELTDLERYVRQADLIITGEGKLDRQSAQGKVVEGVARLAEQYGKPLVGVCGIAAPGAADLFPFRQFYTLRSLVDTQKAAMQRAAALLADVGRLIGSGGN